MTVKLCECGCGEPAPIATMTDARRNARKGEPRRFIYGHNIRSKPQGYVRVLASDHPRADSNGYVLGHIPVAEKALGEPLPPGAQVHHVNGDGTDNRNKNLVVCQDHAYHMLLHRRQRALDACGHADWLRCQYCKQYDDPANMRCNPKRACQAYHRECQRAYTRRQRTLARAALEGET